MHGQNHIKFASLYIYFPSSLYELISHVDSLSWTCIFPPLIYLRKINNYTRSDLLLYYIIHIKGKTIQINRDASACRFTLLRKRWEVSKRVRFSQIRGSAALWPRTVLQQKAYILQHLFSGTYSKRWRHFHFRSMIRSYETEQYKKWGLVQPWAVSWKFSDNS